MSTKKCICGHAKELHYKYSNGGKNRHGCEWVCSAKNCSGWQDCNLENEVPA